MKNKYRIRVIDFLHALTSVSLFLFLFHAFYVYLPFPSPLLFRFFFYFPSLPLLSQAAVEKRALPATTICRSESTAGLWYTGSMVSRYTPAFTAPSPRPRGEPMRSPAASRRAPPPASSARPLPQLLPRCPLTTPLSGEPCFTAPLVLCSRGSRDVSTLGLSECQFFYEPTTQTLMSCNKNHVVISADDWIF